MFLDNEEPKIFYENQEENNEPIKSEFEGMYTIKISNNPTNRKKEKDPDLNYDLLKMTEVEFDNYVSLIEKMDSPLISGKTLDYKTQDELDWFEAVAQIEAKKSKKERKSRKKTALRTDDSFTLDEKASMEKFFGNQIYKIATRDVNFDLQKRLRNKKTLNLNKVSRAKTIGHALFWSMLVISFIVFAALYFYFNKPFGYLYSVVFVPAVIGTIAIILLYVSSAKYKDLAQKYEHALQTELVRLLFVDSITIGQVKELSYRDTKYLRYENQADVKDFIGQLKFPDISHLRLASPMGRSENYGFGSNGNKVFFNIQNVILEKNTETYDNLNFSKLAENISIDITPNITDNIQRLKMIQVDLKDVKNGVKTQINDFNIFKHFEFVKKSASSTSMLQPLIIHDMDFDTTFNVKVDDLNWGHNILVPALKKYKEELNFGQAFRIENSSVWAQNNKIYFLLSFDNVRTTKDGAEETSETTQMIFENDHHEYTNDQLIDGARSLAIALSENYLSLSRSFGPLNRLINIIMKESEKINHFK